MSRRFGVYVVAIALLLTFIGAGAYSSDAYAHRSGCHRWHSCPSDSGSYSCGDWGYDNYCGASGYQAYSPVISYKDEESYADIPNKVIEEPNPDEYIGYRSQKAEGNVGKSKTVITVTMTDGVESSRGDSRTTVISNPVDQVYSVGTREKPAAYIDSFWKEDDKKFLWMTTGENYTITAAGEPSTNFALVKNGRTLQLGRSSTKGYLSFHDIDLNDGDRLEISSYTGGKFLWFMPSVQKKSETTTILSTSKGTYVTAYDTLHNKKETEIYDLASDLKVCTEEIAKKYLESRSTIEKMHDEYDEEITIYYPEPCAIKNENKTL